ncbi:MAG: glycosyltransferase family 2 protein [Candidatus Kerfeldbacteria bacterium]|nr:glycosyltransferase family 2 protein [Candidatus Kerfeldbacteria bacterium]
MKLSIIILNYKTAGLVRQCLRGIFSNPPSEPYEVIVVDNASGDLCLERVAQDFPQTQRIKLEVNCGYAAGNNAGLKMAQGEYVLILNPDITVLEGKLDQLIRFMDKNSKVGLAGPRLVNPDGSLQYSAYRWPSWWLPLFRRTPLGSWGWGRRFLEHYQMYDWDHRTNQPVDWLLGACLIVRRSALNKVGLLDERYFLYVEDTDWCRRFWQAGFQVYYIAEVEFVHFHERLSAQASFGGLFSRVTWIHIASWLKYFKKWGIKVPHR